MEPLRFICTGGDVENLWVPPLQLHAREAICLHLPAIETWEARERFVEALVGVRPCDGLQQLGRMCYAEPPQSRGGLRGLWPQPRAVDWLRRQAGITPAEAQEIVARLKLREKWRISQLAMNPRTLLGLEAAYARGAEVIVFTTIGCDPLGTQAVFEMVAARLDRCAAIHLSYPYSMNGEVRRNCFPGARCVEVIRQDSPALVSLTNSS